jgi:large subunit ribosomal protein L24
MNRKLKIKKGDKVIVIAGSDSGKESTVKEVFPKENKAIVADVNKVIKNTKPSMQSSGGQVTKELPINISNLAHVDPKTGKPTKIGYKTLENGKKVRFAKKSGEIIDQ